ncbi:MAG TPA: efflux RND transporter periplasmic adaptor subunit [Xanthomonadales bacterium]|nr:efflux RND transporter periplasmic adaptor subunit [Xanthomonadales bacterium]
MANTLHRLRYVAIAALALLLVAACGRTAAPAAGGPGRQGGKPAQVTVTTVATKPWADTLEALGTAKANESVTLTAKVTETVERVNFQDGDLVDAGQVLVDLSGRAEVAGLEEAAAAYKEAKQQYERQAELVGQGTIARSQLDTQVALRDAAYARMQAIRARLADRVISAPFAGVLGFRQVSPGTLVTPGTVIATLDDISRIKLDFTVPETFLAAVAPKQRVRARSVAFPDRNFEGEVTSIDSRVDPQTRAVQVRAEIPNPESVLRPGMLLTVTLFRPEREAIVVPELALTQVGSRSFVFVLKPDSTVQQRVVSTGSRRRGEVEIAEGLAAGERIVVEGTVKLRDGAKVAATEIAADASLTAGTNDATDAAPPTAN